MKLLICHQKANLEQVNYLLYSSKEVKRKKKSQYSIVLQDKQKSQTKQTNKEKKPTHT